MPVIKSAIKKLRQDRKREKQNDALRDSVVAAVRSAKKTKTSSSVKNAISIIDKASKNRLLHKNKASRMKSSLSKLARPESGRTKATAVAKIAPKTQKAKTTKPKTASTTARKKASAKKS